MLKKIDWESQIGRRMRLRDLHVFSTVVQLGSMAKAAQQLGVSAPAVSEVIADLEAAVGVRLLDRKHQGVEATAYGAALAKRSLAAFDELRQSIRDIEFLSDPSVGELRMGCPDSISAAILQPIIERFAQLYPRVVLDVDTVNNLTFARRLRERSLDLVLARGGWPLEDPHLVDDMNVETLFEDELVIVAGNKSPLARRRSIDIAELRDERWILTSNDRWNYQIIADAFAQRGIAMPKISMQTLSVHLRANMAATGRFITTLPRSVLMLYADRLDLKMLPVDLPARVWPIVMATLRDRSLSPVVERFMDCARDVSRSIAAANSKRKVSKRGTRPGAAPRLLCEP
jgi:DNA-binding transcriptional LysR family regulator